MVLGEKGKRTNEPVAIIDTNHQGRKHIDAYVKKREVNVLSIH
jgi:hypothetical protein